MNLTVTNGTENKFKFTLFADGVLIDHTTILAAKLHTIFGTTLADSEIDPTDWDFTNTGFITVKLGLTQSLSNTYSCKLIVKTADNTTGLAWAGTIISLTIQP